MMTINPEATFRQAWCAECAGNTEQRPRFPSASSAQHWVCTVCDASVLPDAKPNRPMSVVRRDVPQQAAMIHPAAFKGPAKTIADARSCEQGSDCDACTWGEDDACPCDCDVARSLDRQLAEMQHVLESTTAERDVWRAEAERMTARVKVLEKRCAVIAMLAMGECSLRNETTQDIEKL